MRARIAQFATPRKLVAMECGAAALATAVAVLVLGATPWAFALLGVCAFAMAPALALAGRLERRGPR